MGYGKIVATGLCVVFLAAAAQAGVVQLGEWTVDQDNYNNTLSPSQNRGSTDASRAAKNKQETTWYGDWSDGDLAELKGHITTIAGGGGIYGTDYWVEFLTATNDWGINGGASFTPRVSAFLSQVDWDEYQATNNVASTGVSWFRHDTGAGVQFWGLADIDNTAPVVGGWDTPSVYDPRYISWNTAVLDEPLVTALTDDPNCRGLRMWDEDWYNDVNMARERWGGAGAARLRLFYSEPVPPIPETGSAVILLLGAAGLARKSRRW